MATRFYLPASGTPPLASLAVDGNWERSDNLTRLPCHTIKSNTSLTQMSATWPITSTGQWVWRQFQSKRLASGYSWTTSDTVSMVIKVAEAVPQCDSHLAYSIRVVSGDGSTVRGTIGLYHATSTEYPTSLATIATRIHAARTDGASNFSSQAGDRIIIEIGHHGVTPAADVVYNNYGDPSATEDYALTAGLTTDLCPWVELSRDIIFDLRSSKSAYLKGQEAALDNQLAFASGQANILSSKTAYTEGQEIQGSLSSILAFLAGGINTLDNQIAFLQGQSSLLDNQLAFLTGLANTLENQIAYLAGKADALSGKSAFLEGAELTISSLDAFLAGQGTNLSNQIVYMVGRGIPLMPDGTIGQSGSWKREDESTVNLHLSLNEFPSPNDTNYVKHDLVAGEEWFECSLQNPIGTPGAGDVIIWWRGADLNLTDSCEITVELREGETVRASMVQTLPDSYTTYSYTLSAGEKASISNWNNVRLRVRVTAV